MNHRVLVVDDEENIRELIRRKLEVCGYDVKEAADGREAIRQLTEDFFDLAIVDIVMPEQDGLEVIMHVTKEQPGFPIIAVSALGNDLFLTSAKGLGAARVFRKPFNLGELMAAVGELLPGSQQAVGVL